MSRLHFPRDFDRYFLILGNGNRNNNNNNNGESDTEEGTWTDYLISKNRTIEDIVICCAYNNNTTIISYGTIVGRFCFQQLFSF